MDRRARYRDQDARRTREQPWRRWYKTARWQRVAKAQIGEHPLCNRCSTDERPVPASVCNHRIPHKGDETLFWSGPFESLCAPCHDGPTQAEERRGHVIGSTIEGRPRDPAHPWNR